MWKEMKNRTLIAASIGIVAAVSAVLTAVAAVIPNHTGFTLPNGLEVIIEEDNRQPLIDMIMLFRIGSSSDSARLAGLAAITAAMLKEGSRNFPADLLMASVDSTGGTLDIETEHDAIIIRGNFLSRDLDFGLRVFSDLVLYPQLDNVSLSRLKRSMISAIRRRNNIAEYRLTDALYRHVYTDNGFGLPPVGTSSGLRRVGIDDVRRFYDSNLRPNNAVLILTGDLKTGKARQLIKKYFESWQKGQDFFRPIVNAVVPDSQLIILIDSPEAPASQFIIGTLAPPYAGKETPPLLLMNYILGAGDCASRLWQALVRDRGLAASIKSVIDWSPHTGMIYIAGNGSNEAAVDAIKQSLAVIDDLRKIRIPARELEDARSYFRGRIPRYFETAAGVADKVARLSILGVKLDHFDRLLAGFDKVDPIRIRETASQFLKENNLTIVVIGPELILKPGLSEMGPVEVISSGKE
jgi:zinc protease